MGEDRYIVTSSLIGWAHNQNEYLRAQVENIGGIEWIIDKADPHSVRRDVKAADDVADEGEQVVPVVGDRARTVHDENHIHNLSTAVCKRNILHLILGQHCCSNFMKDCISIYIHLVLFAMVQLTMSQVDQSLLMGSLGIDFKD